MDIATLFFRNRRLTFLTIAVIVVAGVGALTVLPRQEDPILTMRYGEVITFAPGSTAERVEILITDKIEHKLKELYEINTMRSLSRAGASIINIEMDDSYKKDDVDAIWSKIRDKVAEVELPDNATRPEIIQRTTMASTIIVGLVWQGQGPAPLAIMSRLALNLEDQFKLLSGTRETEVFGAVEEEMRITVDPLLLNATGLTVADVASALAQADSKIPAGRVRNKHHDIVIEVGGELVSTQRIRAIPIKSRFQNRIVRVGDIATVEKSYKKPVRSKAFVEGKPSVNVSAVMQENKRIDLWAQTARARVESWSQKIPPQIAVVTVFDQDNYVTERLGTLLSNLMLGVTLVTLVLFITLGWRSALVVGATLPLTFLMVLSEVNFASMALHQTLITGLIVSLGLLIDNAIVVVDDYNSRLKKGVSIASAISKTVRHLFVPLMASTLTTVMAFLPIALMPGGGGEFVGPIAVSVIFSLLSSFVLAMTIIPALAGYTTPRHRHEAHAKASSKAKTSWWQHGYNNPTLARLYHKSLTYVTTHPWQGIGYSLLLPIVGFSLGNTLDEQFFPANDRNQFQVQIILPPQASIEQAEVFMVRADAIIRQHKDVLTSNWYLGTQGPRVYYNSLNTNRGLAGFASGIVTTVSTKATENLLPNLQQQLTTALPEAIVLALPFEQGPPFESPIAVRVIGDNITDLIETGNKLRNILADMPSVTYARSKITRDLPKIVFTLDEEEAKFGNLRLTQISQRLNSALEGTTGGTVIEQTEELPVRVQINQNTIQDLAAIASTQIVVPRSPLSQEFTTVPLDTLGTSSLHPTTATITRYQGERSNTVQAYLVPYVLPAVALKDFGQRLENSDLDLPPTVRLEFGGESEERSTAMGQLMVYALPILVLMVGVVVLSFNSFSFAGIILCVAFLSVGLALFGVWIFDYPLGFVAIVGTMGLMGLAINDSIVVLSALRASTKAMQGDQATIVRVVERATRHIVSTTLTTIAGFLPLILFGGRFWPPMATAIVGGITGAGILSLYMTPCIFLMIARRQKARALNQRKTAL